MVSRDNRVKASRNNGDDLFSSIINGDSEQVPDEHVLDEMFNQRTTKHADDAIDYEDIDELADDDLPMEEEASGDHGATGDSAHQDGFDDVFGDDANLPLGIEEEERLVNQANDEFDGFFGDDVQDGFSGLDANHIPQDKNHLAHDDIFSNLDQNHHIDDDGMTDLNMGGIFEEDTHDETHPNLAESRKRSLDEPQVKSLKKQKLEKLIKKLESKLLHKNISYYFPDYKKGKPYNNHFLSIPNPLYYSYNKPPISSKENVKPLIPTKLSLDVDIDQRKAFKSRKMEYKFKTNLNDFKDASNKYGIVDITPNDLEFIQELELSGSNTQSLLKQIPFLSSDGANNDRFLNFEKDLILSTTDWNDDSIINAGAVSKKNKLGAKSGSPVSDQLLNSTYDYDDENIFSGQIASEKFKLDMNDPNLLFVPEKRNNSTDRLRAFIPRDSKLLEMKFNVSNDKQYEILKNNYNTKVRSQLSNLSIEHSIPALRLQTPYYKVRLNKESSRAFHRPKFHVRSGSLISFSKLKLRKRKKDRNRTPQEIFSQTGDLTAADTGTIIGMEYAEEYPQILSNFGMGSKLINYYRKERDDDNSRPKAPVGETHVLGVEDRSPFWNYGYVAKGDFVPTLYNNMLRAPIFKHEPKNTDFLLIRSQGAGNHIRHFLRPMNHLFTVGHIFPAVEVPAPHSRKVTNTFKNRLKMVVYRTMNRKGVAHVSVKDVSKHFPDQSDMQNRQRLKEFMEYQRKGEDQGFWRMKNTNVVPTEEKIRSMITPEDASLLDSMQHGQQVLNDFNAIYNEDPRKDEQTKKIKEEEAKGNEKQKEKEGEGDKDKEKEKEKDKKKDVEKPKKGKDKEKDKEDKDKDEEDIDEELAPWNSSRNFLSANSSKAMLQLNGEGDPTGIGLGFSFLRATQKNPFQLLFPQPRENVPKNNTAAYQQKLYETEVSRIWYAQRRSLTVEPHEGHSLDNLYNEYKPHDHLEYLKTKLEMEQADRAKAIEPSANKSSQQPSVLKITRRVRDENNIVQRKVEIIHDPRVISAYIKRRKEIEGEKMSNADVNDIIPTNDIEMNKIRKKALQDKIASLQKRAKLSKGRKGTSKDPLHAAAANGGTIIDANTVMLPDGTYAIGGKGIGKGKSLNRRCKSCGAFGHIRTNKSCPLYFQTKGGTVPPSKELKEMVQSQNADKTEFQPPSSAASSTSAAPPSGPL